MYEAYWQLTGQPFANTSDPRFYYPTETHQGALLKLRYAVEGKRGGALLAGSSGLGKSLLAQALLQQLPEQFAPRVNIVFPQMPPEQLVAFIAGELAGKHAPVPPTLEQSVHVINQVLARNSAAGRHAVVVIDEAQLLRNNGGFETARLLLNFEYGGQAGLTLVLIGQPALLAALERAPELDERLSVKCLLRALTLDETVSYVSFRLRAAGAKRDIFDQPALEAVHRLALGNPRRIHRLCDLALLVGYAEERRTITVEQIESVSQELVTLGQE